MDDTIDRSAGEEFETGHTPVHHSRVAGVSLAWKVTIPVLASAAVVAGALFYMVHAKARTGLDRELDHFGTHLAMSLALPDVASWSATGGTLAAAAEQLVKASEEYGTFLAERYGIRVSKVDADAGLPKNLSAAFKEQQARVIKEFNEARERNKARMNGLLRLALTDNGGTAPSDVVDAFILQAERNISVARANLEGGSFESSSPMRNFLTDEGGVTETEIRDGLIEGQAVRSFSHPIRSAKGDITHRAFVFLSTARIPELLQQLRSRSTQLAFLFVVLAGLVAYVVTRLATAPLKKLTHHADVIAAGDFHHRSKVKTDDEIGQLARTMDSMVRRIEHAVAERDEAIAEDLHAQLIAREIPYVLGFDVDIVHLLSNEAGGAYYDFLDLPDKRYGFVIAEGSERGIPAAMSVATAGALIRSEAMKGGDLREALIQVNELLHACLHADTSVAVLLAALDPASSTLTVYGAGNLPFLTHRAGEEKVERIVPGELPLGTDLGSRFADSVKETRIEMAPGDRVVLGNDGAERLTSERGEVLGETRWFGFLESTSAMPAHRFKPELKRLLKGFVGRGKVEDDVVVLSIRRSSE